MEVEGARAGNSRLGQGARWDWDGREESNCEVVGRLGQAGQDYQDWRPGGGEAMADLTKKHTLRSLPRVRGRKILGQGEREAGSKREAEQEIDRG